MKKRWIAVLTAAALLVTALPVAAFAEEPVFAEAAEETVFQEESLEEEPSQEPEEAPSEEPAGEETGGGNEVQPPEEELPEEDPEESPEEPVDENAPLFPLQREEHIAFVSGDNDYVRPDDNLRRSEAASLVYKLLTDPAEPSGNPFVDVNPGNWFQTCVNSMAEMGILSGMGDGEFSPNANMTRVQFVTMLSKLFPLKTGKVTFTDVSADHWAYSYIQNAVARGWVHGYPDGTFRPNDPISRAEAFATINNMLGRSPDKATIDAQGKFLIYVDLPYDHWAYYHIMEASVAHAHTTDENGVEIWGAYTTPASKRGPGPHLIDGQLYYVGSNYRYLRNTDVGVLHFDNNGRYTTGNSELDSRLTQVILRETVATDTLYNNLRRLYDHMVNDYSYLAAGYPQQGSTGWENSYALTMLQRGRGNCYSYAALYALLARRLGYQAQPVSGMVTVRGSSHWQYGYYDAHGWVEITLNGTVYVCDPQLRAGHAARWGYNWDLFMKPYGTSVATYRVNGQIKS